MGFAAVWQSEIITGNPMKRMHQFAAAAAFAVASCGAQATAVYTNEASFLAAAGGSLAFESFETLQSSAPTQYDFADVSFACTGTSHCPGFFGSSGAFSYDGWRSVFFSSPDTSTFTFAHAVNAFGIWIGDAGSTGAITLDVALNNGGSAAALANFTGDSLNWQYFGLIADTPFTSVTFIPSNRGDGIYFDALRYGEANVHAVPEPASALLLGIAGIGLLAARRKRGARR
jgi:hypothetical protein